MFCSDEGACVRFGGGSTVDRHPTHTLQRRSWFQRSSGATGSLNDARQCSPATVIPLSPPPPRHLHQVQTDASVTIRPLVLTPAQRVSHTSPETDVLQR